MKSERPAIVKYNSMLSRNVGICEGDVAAILPSDQRVSVFGQLFGFAIGASLKGMGASGLTVESEIKRLEEVIEYCKTEGIFIIAVHVGGTSKRGAPGSDNERMIDTVAPSADYLIVTKDSNKDGRFSSIAEEKGIPLTEIEYALNLVDTLNQVFN